MDRFSASPFSVSLRLRVNAFRTMTADEYRTHRGAVLCYSAVLNIRLTKAGCPAGLFFGPRLLWWLMGGRG